MCICLGIWLTNKFQVTNIHLSLQMMIFSMSEQKKIRQSFHGVSVPNYTINFVVVASGNDIYDWVQQTKEFPK